MTKKTMTILLLAISTALLLTACVSGQNQSNQDDSTQGGATQSVRSYEDFIDSNKVFAAQIGDIYGEVAKTIFKAKQVSEFTLAPDMLEAVRMGKVDAAITDDAYIAQIRESGLYPDLEYLSVPKEVFVNRASNVFHNTQMRDAFNQWLELAIEDGTFDEVYNRWIGVPLPDESEIPTFQLTGENGTLRVCNTGNFPPFSYFGSANVPIGFDEEIVNRFAQYLGMNVEHTAMAYDAIIPYVISGKADMSGCSFTVTDERAESVIFGEPFTKAHAVLIVLKPSVNSGGLADGTDLVGGTEGGDAAKAGFVQWVHTSVERNLLTDNRWKLIVDGLGVTLTISVAAQILGTALGCVVCWLLTRQSRLVKGIGQLYCGLIRGTPIVVLLMITYYIIFGNSNISNVLIAVVAFTLITAATVAALLKGAIETVDPVEIEAARSMGFSAFKGFMTVTLPQAIRRALPGYTNGFVELVKATAIVGYIAIQDLTRAADIIRSRTYDAYFPLLFVAILYLIVTTICVQLFKIIIRKINGGEAR